MRRLTACLLVLAVLFGGFAACSSPASKAPPPPASSAPPPPPPYKPNPLTGEKMAADFNENRRITAIMINNIAQCRPHRGVYQADVLFEIMVEGGVTRFMGLFEDYEKLTDVGPVRSARDQFFRLLVPYRGLYLHIGYSAIAQQYIKDNDYTDYDINLDANLDAVYWDENRKGYDQEHRAYTNGKLLTPFIQKKKIDMNRKLTSPIFDFVKYNDPRRVLPGEGAEKIFIRHSNLAQTSFLYDESSNKYMMSMYNYLNGRTTPAMDEALKGQLGYENVVVLFTTITKYYYPGGNPKGDPDYKKVEYDHGGLGYYFSDGRWQKIRWEKGPAQYALFLKDETGDHNLKVNPGKTYVAVVSLDEYKQFKYSAVEKATSSVSGAAKPASAASKPASAAVASKAVISAKSTAPVTTSKPKI